MRRVEMSLPLHGVLAFGLVLTVAACAQTQWQSSGTGPSQTLRTADQAMDQEVTDRIDRFRRLAGMQGIRPPQIEAVTLPAAAVPGASRAVPVIRVTFDERDFFDPGGTDPRPQGLQVLKVVAENMRRDVPDVRLTVLGHTDASGAETQNQALSQARAQSVVQSLVGFGVNPGQLSAIAIGSAQPLAPNADAPGRARNRRVEFLISPYDQANLSAVTVRSINPAFLAIGTTTVRTARRDVAVLRPSYIGPADFSEAPVAGGPARRVQLASAGTSLAIGENDSGSPVSVAAQTTTRTLATAPADSGSPVTSAAAQYQY